VEESHIISVPSAEIRLLEGSKKKKIVKYLCEVSSAGVVSGAEFTYTDFISFDEIVSPQLEAENLEMPEAVWFGADKPLTVEKRRGMFEVYLRKVCQKKWLWPEVSKLLKMDIATLLQEEKTKRAQRRNTALALTRSALAQRQQEEALQAVQEALQLPEGWVEYKDPQDRTYFYNELTEVSSWIRPE
jgi:hypothetical protein